MGKVTFTINEQVLETEDGASVLEAALQNDIYIPHLCYHPELESRGACRLCVVEIDGRLVTACRTPVEPGMVVRTNTPEVDRAVRPVVELLIANHHITCRGCPSSGKCQLQKLMAELRIDRRRVRRLRTPEEELPIDTSPPCFDYDPNKCVLCGICIQTCGKIHGTSSLYFLNRGTDTRVAFYGDEARCAACLECIKRCPVGVLLPKQASNAS
jgi:formate dehydrogenase major subunit